MGDYPIAIYPGSFDPLTNGHVDLIDRALKVFDRLIIAIAVNPLKDPLFTAEERKNLIIEALNDNHRVVVDMFSGLLVDYVKKMKGRAIVRGLRAVSDFEMEMQMANMNRRLYPGAETFFMMASEEHFYLSSRIVKEVAMFGGSVAAFVPANVHNKLKEKYPQLP